MEPVKYVRHDADIKWSSKSYRMSRAEREKISTSCASQSAKVLDNLKKENFNSLSYNDHHCKIKQKIGDAPFPSAKFPGENQIDEKKATKDGELVKHMSNLPHYLQHMKRGENLQEALFNFGVFDWRRLEQRKSNPLKPQSVCFPQPPSSKESYSQSLKPTGGRAATLEDAKTAPKNTLLCPENLRRTNNSGGKTYLHAKPEMGREKDSQPNNNRGTRTCSSSVKDCEVLCFPKGTIESLQADSTRRKDQFHEFTLPDQDCQGRSKTIVLILPRDSSKNSCLGNTQTSKSTMPKDRSQSETNSRSFLKSCAVDEEISSIYLRHEVETNKQLDTTTPCSIHVQTSKDPCGGFNSGSSLDETPTVQSKDKKLFNKSGLLNRSFSYKGSSVPPQSCSTYVQSMSGPLDSESCVNNSSIIRATGNSRDRTSPLRRWLNPLLKPKASNYVDETLLDESSSTDKVCNSLNGRLYSSVQHTQNLDFSSCRAHLQITIRNGIPWFMFTVEKSKDALSAAMRKINSLGKFDYRRIFTFYSFSRIRKKNGGWINHGSKGRSLDTVPNIVAQMKVISSQCPKFTRGGQTDPLVVTEFVLSSVGPRQENIESLKWQQKNELAAIIVKDKVQRETMGSLTSDRTSGFVVESRRLSSTTAILPSGLHGISATGGEPSPLIDRWKSGGICDCGGWDEGCKLRVLSSKFSCLQDPFDLFVQGEVEQQNRLFFSMVISQKGIYSIVYDPSMSPLQAFSICIAFLHTRNLTDPSAVSNLLQEINL
ncbi:hypothetical protein GIB67_038849 [Kingdonia uniflora]|uniref:Uncharacterized protein n=1 Tax=Kingdonia uniflora TaxID=39325 RepID=A0A7J7N1P8_9MAGN|nr:hypothetical protein GIB67_007678 [Kingdonia uniflora]KAF6170585.1 hypothetical protein GIB67_038849 [Kingdonia uniflora]